jgi:hypothetical protein
MKIAWIVLFVAFISMLVGTCSIEQISIEKDELIICNYGYWGAKRTSIKIIKRNEIKAVDVSLRAGTAVDCATPHGVRILTGNECIWLSSYIFNSKGKANKYRGLIEDGIKKSNFFSRRMSNIVCVYGSLVLLVLWFLFDRKIFQ